MPSDNAAARVSGPRTASSVTPLALFADELPANAVPADVVVAPSLKVQLGSTVPAELFSRIRHRERFLPDHPVLWTQDPASQMWCPLWLRQRQAWLCTALHAGEAPPTALTGALYAQLHCAGVVVSLQTLAERRAYGERLTAKARGALEHDERRPAAAPAWPLWFTGPQGPRSVELAPGDGVFFRGCELPHWRGTAMPEHSQTNLLLHYVPSEWAGVVD